MPDRTPADESILFHCRSCNAVRECDRETLSTAARDDSAWPRCCGTRMAVSFPHGHADLVTSPPPPAP